MTDVIERPFAAKTKETNAPVRTEWRSSDTAQWGKADEGVGSDIWSLLSIPVPKRRSVARDFASAISAKSEVVEVWVTDVENDLSMAVALHGSASEIEVRTAFLDLVMERLNPHEGDLHVFPSGCVPDWVKRGEQL